MKRAPAKSVQQLQKVHQRQDPLMQISADTNIQLQRYV